MLEGEWTFRTLKYESIVGTISVQEHTILLLTDGLGCVFCSVSTAGWCTALSHSNFKHLEFLDASSSTPLHPFFLFMSFWLHVKIFKFFLTDLPRLHRTIQIFLSDMNPFCHGHQLPYSPQIVTFISHFSGTGVLALHSPGRMSRGSLVINITSSVGSPGWKEMSKCGLTSVLSDKVQLPSPKRCNSINY